MVLAQQMRLVRAVPAEVEEAQRFAVDLVALSGPGELAVREVPPRDVVGGVPDDGRVEEARREIDPALVDEPAAFRLDDALARHTLHPPVEEALSLIALAEPDEAQVVHT